MRERERHRVLFLLVLAGLFGLPSPSLAQPMDPLEPGDSTPEEELLPTSDTDPGSNLARPADALASGSQSATDSDQRFDAIMGNQQTTAHPNQSSSLLDLLNTPSPEAQLTPKVEVSLEEFNRVRGRLRTLQRELGRANGPAVVLGAAEYVGRGREGALELKLKLQMTLGQPNRWKVVPLLGDDAVLVRVTADGKELPVSRRNGYHVWITRRVGEVTVELDLLVPARGPRGSLEYGFTVARTPVSRFSCRFPVAGLEPRLDSAVRSTTRTVGNSTEFEASLAPTTRIHLVGFRDLGEREQRTAKVYSESTSLLSVGEAAVDLFTVIRYTILYGGAKSFDIAIPPNTTVVSADGKGAFRFELENGPRGTILRGETEFPIRDSFEISLRLRHELDEKASSFAVPLPHCLGVEREHGWLGVEVTGKSRLEEVSRERALEIDVRQLPDEMLAGAVSPILKAYRYHDATAKVTLAAARLPEKEPISASIDRILASTVVSPDGKALTDLRITLRNRLRHSVTLTLPSHVEVRSTLIDGEPVRPSRNEAGGVMLPLKRSAGQSQLQPFTIQVILAGDFGPLRLAGLKSLQLPSIDLPVSSAAWTIYLPANNLYSAPRGDIHSQQLLGYATWHPPVPRGAQASRQPRGTTSEGGAVGSANTGAMPVRIELPEKGIRFEYERFWIEAGRPVSTSFLYGRSWLRFPAALSLLGLLVACLVLVARRWSARPQRSIAFWAALTAALATLWPLSKIGGFPVVFVGASLAALVFFRRPLLQMGSEHMGGLWARFRARERAPMTKWLLIWKLLLVGAFGALGFGLLVCLVRLFHLSRLQG